jgi:hypothetical protein
MLLAAPVRADSFKGDIFCEFSSGIQGKVKIEGRGTAIFRVDGLPANTEFICDIECEIFGDDVERPCSSADHGRINATFKNAVDICIGPVAEIDLGPDVICASGFVSSAILH